MTHSQARLFVLGATGGTGRHVVDHALAAGHRVTALVREPERLAARPGLTVHRGDATDAPRLAALLPGHDAVICCIGAPARSRQRVREASARALVDAMATAEVSRLVVQSSFGVRESHAHLPWFLRWVVVPLWLARPFADHAAQEEIVEASDLAWTLVRPPHLSDAEGTGQVTHGWQQPGSRPMAVPRADVAGFLVELATGDAYARQPVAVTAAA